MNENKEHEREVQTLHHFGTWSTTDRSIIECFVKVQKLVAYN